MDRHLFHDQPDPNQVTVDESQPSAVNTQVNNLDSEQGTPEMGSQTHDCKNLQTPTNDVTPNISNEEVVQVNETEVSSDQIPTNSEYDTSDPSLQGKSVKLLYICYLQPGHPQVHLHSERISSSLSQKR